MIAKFQEIASEQTTINSSIIQGSVIGPTLCYTFLRSLPEHPSTFIAKYADDTYLLIGSSHIDTAQAEFAQISSWAYGNNLCLNPTKHVN